MWLDAHQVPRSKSKTLTAYPTSCDDLPMWNFDGSSTEQSPGENSDVYLVPRALFRDPFRGGRHVLVMSECVQFDMQPAIGNTRAACVDSHNAYAELDPWYGIEQEYQTLRGDSTS